MDKKIQEKQKRNEENDNSWKNKKDDVEHKKKIVKDTKLEQSRKKNKKRKQSIKDKRK